MATQVRGEEVPHWLERLPAQDALRPRGPATRSTSGCRARTCRKPENRIRYDGEKTVLELRETSLEAHQRLRKKLETIMKAAGCAPFLLERNLYLGKDIPVGGTAHQAGTLRFGTDPAHVGARHRTARRTSSTISTVTDAGFFPSIGAVNPTLTIIANALRVADHLRGRLGATDRPAAEPAIGNSYVLAGRSPALQARLRSRSMPDYEVIDPSFRRMVLPNAELKVLGEGFAWLEGPVWFADQQCLLVSRPPRATG